MKYAIIGGTGFEKAFPKGKKIEIHTPFGKSHIIHPHGKDFYFLARHGSDHSIAPHKINYRSNLWALKDLGVDYIFSLCAVGSMQKKFAPGQVLLAKDFLDFTKSRIQTFFDGEMFPLKHLEMTEPFSPNLNSLFKKMYNPNIEQVVYVATEGPRFESAAEISYYSKIGGDVVGMTGVPEVILARELEIEYACICIVTNYCTGLVDYVSEETIKAAKKSQNEEILATIEKIFLDQGSLEKRTISHFC